MRKKGTIKKDEFVEDSKMLDSMLSDLIYLGRVTKEVKINKFSFKIKTLTEEENREILNRLLKIEESRRLVCAKAMTLSRCIISVNEVPFDELGKAHLNDEEETEENIEIAKNEIILNLQTSVTNTLFKSYEDLVQESISSIELDKIKN